MAPQDTPQGKLAFEFATALVMRDFQRAHQMLSQSAQADWPADQLQETHDGMVDYFESPPDEVAVVNAMDQWPDKANGDIGWAYAAIVGEDGSEAVTVIVAAEGDRHVIRNVEWGRP